MPRICLAVITVALIVTVPMRAEPSANAPGTVANPVTHPSKCDWAPVYVAADDLESSLRSDLEDGELHKFTFIQAALIAGGVTSRAELQRHVTGFNNLCDSVSCELKPITDPRSKLDLLLRRLHEQLLTGEYRAESSELHRVLDYGHFNCITATILFQALADGCGVPTRAIAAQSHVLCGLPGRSTLYIETTCRDWRSAMVEDCPLQTQKLVQDSRQLSPLQLLGKVYYNLGVARLEALRFADASELLNVAWQLDQQDLAARENLLATYNNWALAECDRGQFHAAHGLLLRGLAIDSSFGPLLANDLHIHQLWVRSLCRAGDFSTAIEVLEEGYRRRPDAELFDRGRIAACELWAEHLLRSKNDLLPAGL